MNIQYKYFPLSLFLDDAVRFGVENVELWGASPHFHMEDMTYAQIRDVRREIESRKLNLVCFTPEQCVYPVNLASDNEDTRRRSRKFFENSIRAAGELGCKKVLVTSGTGYFDESNREDAWKWAADGLYALGEMAADYGTVLALEVLRRDESNLVHDLPSLLRMLNELNHPQDTAHARIYDRLKELCVPVKFSGESRRRVTAQEKLNRLREKRIG